jgi:RNA polymerase sigma factor (sigma-70 family)
LVEHTAENRGVAGSIPALAIFPVAENRERRFGQERVMESFDALFRSEFPAVHRYLHRRLGRDAADDLAAATFAIAYEAWSRFDPLRPPRPWLYGIATNLLRRHYRDEERKLRAYARTGVDRVGGIHEDDVVLRLDADTQKRALAAALAELRHDEREVLLLHAWAELSDAEIAAALSLPLGTVKSRLHRTRERVRTRIAATRQSSLETTYQEKEHR